VSNEGLPRSNRLIPHCSAAKQRFTVANNLFVTKVNFVGIEWKRSPCRLENARYLSLTSIVCACLFMSSPCRLPATRQSRASRSWRVRTCAFLTLTDPVPVFARKVSEAVPRRSRVSAVAGRGAGASGPRCKTQRLPHQAMRYPTSVETSDSLSYLIYKNTGMLETNYLGRPTILQSRQFCGREVESRRCAPGLPPA
jgi:hypothetical protein